MDGFHLQASIACGCIPAHERGESMPFDKRGDQGTFGNPKIVRGPKFLQGGFLVKTGRGLRRVVKPDGHRVGINGLKSEKVPAVLVDWMTDKE